MNPGSNTRTNMASVVTVDGMEEFTTEVLAQLDDELELTGKITSRTVLVATKCPMGKRLPQPKLVFTNAPPGFPETENTVEEYRQSIIEAIQFFRAIGIITIVQCKLIPKKRRVCVGRAVIDAPVKDGIMVLTEHHKGVPVAMVAEYETIYGVRTLGVFLEYQGAAGLFADLMLASADEYLHTVRGAIA